MAVITLALELRSPTGTFGLDILLDTRALHRNTLSRTPVPGHSCPLLLALAFSRTLALALRLLSNKGPHLGSSSPPGSPTRRPPRGACDASVPISSPSRRVSATSTVVGDQLLVRGDLDLRARDCSTASFSALSPVAPTALEYICIYTLHTYILCMCIYICMYVHKVRLAYKVCIVGIAKLPYLVGCEESFPEILLSSLSLIICTQALLPPTQTLAT